MAFIVNGKNEPEKNHSNKTSIVNQPTLGDVSYNRILRTWSVKVFLPTKTTIISGEVRYDGKEVDHLKLGQHIEKHTKEELSHINELYKNNWMHIRDEVKRSHQELD